MSARRNETQHQNQFQSSLKPVLKLYCFSFISMCRQCHLTTDQTACFNRKGKKFASTPKAWGRGARRRMSPYIRHSQHYRSIKAVITLQRLQSVLNAAARLVFSARRPEHITPLLHELHWLKVPERIQFRLCVLTHRCLHGTAPPYLAEIYTSVDG